MPFIETACWLAWKVLRAASRFGSRQRSLAAQKRCGVRTFGETLRELLESRGMSLRQLAAAACIDSGHLSRVSRGVRPVPIGMAEQLENVLDAPGELVPLVAGQREESEGASGGDIDVSQQPVADLVGTVVRTDTPGEGDDDVRRRTALQLIAALGAGTAIPPGAIEGVLHGVDRAVGGAVDLSEWERAVSEYGALINRQPVGALIGDLAADVMAVGELLDRDTTDGPVRAELLRVSSALTSLLAISLGDIGNRRGARMAWGTARRSADASADLRTRVWVRAREAEEAFWAGFPPAHVAALAEEAVTIADGMVCSGLPRAYAVRASLAAEAGDTDSAQRLAGMLPELFEQLPDSVTQDQATFGWHEGRLRWNQAYVHALTGDSHCGKAVDDALALYPPGTLGPSANLEVIRAMGLVHDREIGEGLDHAVEIVHGLPISPARVRMAGQILRLVPRQDRALPAAQELRELTRSLGRPSLLQ